MNTILSVMDMDQKNVPWNGRSHRFCTGCGCSENIEKIVVQCVDAWCIVLDNRDDMMESDTDASDMV
jgi:hypothetical protein